MKGGEIYELLEDISKRCDGGDDYAEDVNILINFVYK